MTSPDTGSLPRPSRTPKKKKRAPRRDKSLLGQIETAFLRLPVAYPYLRVDGAAIGCGLPAEPVTPDEARTVLTDDAVGYDDKDHGWRYLVAQARTADVHRRTATQPTAADWQLVAVGTALPGLKRRIREKEIDRDEDVDAEIVCQFLDHLHNFNPARRNVCGRLINTAVQRHLRRSRPNDQPTDPAWLPEHADTDPRTEDIEPGHPLQVLARLNAQGHIGRDDARLIAYTRLGPLSVQQAAAKLGISETAATMRRIRAEGKIVAELTSKEPNPAGTDTAAAPAYPDTGGHPAAPARLSRTGRRRSAVAVGHRPPGWSCRRSISSSTALTIASSSTVQSSSASIRHAEPGISSANTRTGISSSPQMRNTRLHASPCNRTTKPVPGVCRYVNAPAGADAATSAASSTTRRRCDIREIRVFTARSSNQPANASRSDSAVAIRSANRIRVVVTASSPRGRPRPSPSTFPTGAASHGRISPCTRTASHLPTPRCQPGHGKGIRQPFGRTPGSHGGRRWTRTPRTPPRSRLRVPRSPGRRPPEASGRRGGLGCQAAARSVRRRFQRSSPHRGHADYDVYEQPGCTCRALVSHRDLRRLRLPWAEPNRACPWRKAVR